MAGVGAAELRRRCVGRTIVDVLVDEVPVQRWVRQGKELSLNDEIDQVWRGLVLDDGTRITADGGEDAGGGYGFLNIEPPGGS